MSEMSTYQSKFVSYLKSGEWEGTIPENMEVYPWLIEHNVKQAFNKAFPISKSHLTDDKWDALLDDCYRNLVYDCDQWQDVPSELLVFIQNYGRQYGEEYPWLIEMMYYEIEERRQFAQQDQHEAIVVNQAIDLSRKYGLSVNASIHAFAFPVYMEGWTPNGDTGSYFLLMYRDHLDFKIHKLEINVFLYQLLMCMDIEASLDHAIRNTIDMMGVPMSDDILQNCLLFLNDLSNKRILISLD